MATKFIRKSGSDSNSGNSAGSAWLTINKALTTMASGDQAYIGAGTYRETVTMTITPAAETKLIGDVDGAQTGDAGEVVWTAYTTNDTTTPATAATLNLNAKSFLTFQNLTLIGGNVSGAGCVTSGASKNITFTDCVFAASRQASSSWVVTMAGTVDVAQNWTFERCTFFGNMSGGGPSLYLQNLPRSATADYNAVVLIQNCLFVGGGSALLLDSSGATAFYPGGINVYNCTAIATSATAFWFNCRLSTSITCNVNNCLIHGNDGVKTVNTGDLLENFNVFLTATPRTNVNAGANSLSAPTIAPMFELMRWAIAGRLPRLFFMPADGSPFLGFGSAGSPPTVDLLNRPRPAGGASTSLATGAFERHDTGAREASVVDASTYSLKLTGPADHELLIPVNAAATSITLRARYDTNHAATNKPQAILRANGQIGVATQTVTMTAAVDTWETLTIGPFTPGAKGFVTVRLVSRSAAGNGIAYFDTIASTAIGTGNEDYWNRGEAFPAATSTSTGGSPWHFP
jgi:hypothetical protein